MKTFIGILFLLIGIMGLIIICIETLKDEQINQSKAYWSIMLAAFCGVFVMSGIILLII